jgi:ubiquitin-activating enzyme E1
LQKDHFEFVYTASILRAQLYNLEPILNRLDVANLAQAYQSKPFVPRDGVRIAVTDAEATNEAENGAGADGEGL